MKQEFDELLCKQYPKIFRDRHAPMTETCMCWGFDVGDGWFNIINQLCANIQHHIDWSRRQRSHALRYNRALKRAFDGNEVELLSHFTFDRNARQSKNWSEYAYRSVREELVLYQCFR